MIGVALSAELVKTISQKHKNKKEPMALFCFLLVCLKKESVFMFFQNAIGINIIICYIYNISKWGESV